MKSGSNVNIIAKLNELKKQINDKEHSDLDLEQVIQTLSIVYDAIDSTVGGIIITDLKGIIRYVNPSFLKLFQYQSKQELMGRNAVDFFATDEILKFTDVQMIIDASNGFTEEFSVKAANGTLFFVEVSSSPVTDTENNPIGRMASFVNITQRKQLELERDTLIRKLQDSINKIRTLKGLLPVCASCKKIRNDQGYWQSIEKYIIENTDAQISHGLCPDCAKKLYPDIFDEVTDNDAIQKK